MIYQVEIIPVTYWAVWSNSAVRFCRLVKEIRPSRFGRMGKSPRGWHRMQYLSTINWSQLTYLVNKKNIVILYLVFVRLCYLPLPFQIQMWDSLPCIHKTVLIRIKVHHQIPVLRNRIEINILNCMWNEPLWDYWHKLSYHIGQGSAISN